MADNYRAPPLSVRLSQDDREWLTKLAQHEDVSTDALVKRAVQHFRHWQEEGEETLKEALEIFEAERSSREDERRRRLYFQREYGLQSRRLHKIMRDERDLRAKYENQLRDERDLRAKYENQLRDERDLRAKYEDQLRDERDLRVAYENQLRDERNLRAERENQLREQRDGYEREARAPVVYLDVLYDPTVTKLLTLAIRSESDAEAMTAFAKARTIHRKNANLFHACSSPGHVKLLPKRSRHKSNPRANRTSSPRLVPPQLA